MCAIGLAQLAFEPFVTPYMLSVDLQHLIASLSTLYAYTLRQYNAKTNFNHYQYFPGLWNTRFLFLPTLIPVARYACSS